MGNIRTLIRENFIYRTFKNVVIKSFRRLPISPRRIVFDNFGGRGYGDDPKYIAEELRKRNLGLELIWLTSDMKTELPEGIKKVKYGTIRAAYYWSTAKIWVDNIKSSIKVEKKPEQYYIQTWHSTLGFKKNEQDAKSLTDKYLQQTQEDAARTDLMYSDNDFRADKYKNRYWYSGEVIKCDVPRMSIMFHPSDELQTKVRSSFGISAEKKIVLYAPTFRKRTDIDTYSFDYKQCISVLNAKFGGDFVMLIRLHPNEARYGNTLAVYDDKMIFNASHYPDMQELLAVSNVLITDYSGCMFDFGLVKKPVFLLAKDLEWYLAEDREVYFGLDEVPFKLAKTDEELQQNIAGFSEPEYKKACKEFADKIGFEDFGRGAEYLADLIIRKIEG